MDHLVKLKEVGKIKNIGLTNFDTEHMALLMDRGAPIVSNQVKIHRKNTEPYDKSLNILSGYKF